jgi:hypothetical protein
MEKRRPIFDMIANQQLLVLTVAAQFLLKRIRRELMLEKHNSMKRKKKDF